MEQPKEDIAVPDADAAEQATEWVEGEPSEPPRRVAMDVSEADALEQTQPGLEEDDDEFR